MELYSDSKYVIDALEKGWAWGWKKRGWVKSDKTPALTPALWAELLRLEELAADLQARSDEMQAQLLKAPRIVGPRRMMRAFPDLKHGVKKTSLKVLRSRLTRKSGEDEQDKKDA